jgi:hypothetical protein
MIAEVNRSPKHTVPVDADRLDDGPVDRARDQRPGAQGRQELEAIPT